MGFLKGLFGGGQRDEPESEQYKEFQETVPAMMLTHGVLASCDEIANGQGEFGYSIDNPIPVNGPRGEINYLSRLCNKGGKFWFHRVGNAKGAVYPYPVDVYDLIDVGATVYIRLHLGMYHPRRSTKAPRTLSLIPWGQMSEMDRMFSKIGMTGCNQTVPDFPFGMPTFLAQHLIAMGLPTGVAQATCRKMEAVIQSKAPQIRALLAR
ncbi:MAG: hypothetical protein KJ052_00275 [Candidatus Hydrogenedentes bacterium]|nr:hypothetical protein [Candidatus Hydrogenedentota bacterium]